MANVLNKDPFTYAEDRRSFLQDLKRFHTSRGTPFDRIPQIGGTEIDLYRLYQRVIDLGGWQKVNNDLLWEDIQEEFKVPVACTNGSQALKHIYFRYLNIYEKVNYLGLSPDHCGGDQEDGPSRKKVCLPVESIPLTYNYNQHKVNDSQRESTTLSSNLARFSDYEKLEMSLRSGLPNEVDFAVNVCLLLSSEGPHVLKLNKSLHLVPLLLANIGIFDEGPSTLEDVMMHSWNCGKSQRDYLRFWYEVVEDEKVRESITTKNGVYRREKREGSEVLHLGREVGVKDVEGQRVTQLAVLIRNLSFEDVNQQLLASSSLIFKFLMLCVHSSYGTLRQLALDTLGNLATQMVLKPVETTTTQLIMNLIKKSLMDSDKFVIVRALEMLGKLCQLEKNEAILNETLEGETYCRIVQLLMVHDIQLIVHTLEALYQLSELGDPTTTMIANVKSAVDMLVNLITVEAQSYGPDSLVGIKVVEYVPRQDPNAVNSGTSPQPTQTFIQPVAPSQMPDTVIQPAPQVMTSDQVRADVETTASNWLKGTFEVKKTSYISQADLFSEYQQFCSKYGIADLLTPADFVNVVKSAISQATIGEVDRGGGEKEPVYRGLCRRATPKPFAILTGSDRVLKPSGCSVNSLRGPGPANWSLTSDPMSAPLPTQTPTLRQRLMEPPRMSLQQQLVPTGATSSWTPSAVRPTAGGSKTQPTLAPKPSPGTAKKRQIAPTPPPAQPSGPGPGAACPRPPSVVSITPRPGLLASVVHHQRPMSALQQQLQVVGTSQLATNIFQSPGRDHVMIQPSAPALLRPTRLPATDLNMSASVGPNTMTVVSTPSSVSALGSAPSASAGQQFPLIHQALQTEGNLGVGKTAVSVMEQGNDSNLIKSLLAKKVCQNMVRQGNTTPSQSPPPQESCPDSPASSTSEPVSQQQQSHKAESEQTAQPSQTELQSQPVHPQNHPQQQQLGLAQLIQQLKQQPVYKPAPSFRQDQADQNHVQQEQPALSQVVQQPSTTEQLPVVAQNQMQILQQQQAIHLHAGQQSQLVAAQMNVQDQVHVVQQQRTAQPQIVQQPQTPQQHIAVQGHLQIIQPQQSFQPHSVHQHLASQAQIVKQHLATQSHGVQHQLTSRPHGLQQEVVSLPQAARQQLVSQPQGAQQQLASQPQTLQQQLASQPHVAQQQQLASQPQVAQQQLASQPQTLQQQLASQPHVAQQQQLASQPQVAQQQLASQPQTLQQQLTSQPQVAQQQLAPQPQGVQQQLASQAQVAQQLVSQPQVAQQQLASGPQGVQQQLASQPQGVQQLASQPQGVPQQVASQSQGMQQQLGSKSHVVQQPQVVHQQLTSQHQTAQQQLASQPQTLQQQLPSQAEGAQQQQVPSKSPVVQQSQTAPSPQPNPAQNQHPQQQSQQQQIVQHSQPQLLQTHPHIQQVLHLQGQQVVLHQHPGHHQQQIHIQPRISGQQQTLQLQPQQIVLQANPQQQVHIRPQQQIILQQHQQHVVIQGQHGLQQILQQPVQQVHIQPAQQLHIPGQGQLHVQGQGQPLRIQNQSQQPMVIQLPIYQLPQIGTTQMVTVCGNSLPASLAHNTAGGLAQTTIMPYRAIIPHPSASVPAALSNHRPQVSSNGTNPAQQTPNSKQEQGHGSADQADEAVASSSAGVSVQQEAVAQERCVSAVHTTLDTPCQTSEDVSEDRTVAQTLSVQSNAALNGQTSFSQGLIISRASATMSHTAAVSSSLSCPSSLTLSSQHMPSLQSSAMSITQAILSGHEVHKAGSSRTHNAWPSVESQQQHSNRDSGHVNGTKVNMPSGRDCSCLGEVIKTEGEVNGILGSPDSASGDMPPSPVEEGKVEHGLNGLTEGSVNCLKEFAAQRSKELLHSMAEKAGRLNGVIYHENGDIDDEIKMEVDQTQLPGEKVRPEQCEVAVGTDRKLDMWQVNGLSGHTATRDVSASTHSDDSHQALIKQTSVEEVSLDSTDSKLVVNCNKIGDSMGRPLFSPDGSRDSDMSCDSFASSLTDSVSSDKHSSQGSSSFTKPSSAAPSPSPSPSNVFPEVPLVLAGTITVSESSSKRNRKKPPSKSKVEKAPAKAKKRKSVDTKTGTSETPGVAKPPGIEYMCEWAGCRRCFESARLVFIHVTKSHVSLQQESVCQWRGCEPLRRKRWSLVTHLQDHHCSEMALRAGHQRRLQALSGTSQQAAVTHQQAPPIVYPPDAALQAIKRYHIKPPFVEFAEQREGPVTKHIRLTSALILRNLARYSSHGRSQIKQKEQYLSYAALSAVESSTAIASCLWEILHDR